ncbi:Serine/threonine-protein kinase TBK1-like protein, partial [Leptotrombidium deliense]
MSLFRETDNFIWDESGKLGSGATASVYHGFDKNTGEAVAVKCFTNPNSQPIYIQKRLREFELLKKLNHENIVKLIAIEKEYTETKDFVLVMELCRGNCLLDILRDGEHYNGFEDKEFLNIVKHVTAAVKHMRENKIAHRDLKPGNILKHIGHDGQPIYKIGDFGSARELDDGQEFVSICGTRAYLHPNIFAKHFLHKYKVCDSNVDLWSIGVTFYHLATGSLPFRAFNVADHETMYRIVSEKHSGIISGIQETKHGEIKWRSTLPKNCALSPFLRTLVEIMLVRLLECEKSKMWSFEEFFNYVDFLLSHKPVQIVYANRIQESLHYMSPMKTFEQLKLFVQQDAIIAVNNQVYLWNGEEINELKNLDIMSKSPLFVIDRSSEEVKSANVDCRSVAIPNFDQQHANLLVMVKHWQTNAYSLKDAVLKCRQQTKMIHSTVSEIEKFLESKVRLNLKNKHLTEVIFNSLKQQFEHISDMNAFIVELNRLSVESRNENNSDFIVKVTSKFHSLCIKWNDIDKHFLQIEHKVRLLKEEWIEEECNWDAICTTADHHCRTMHEMYKLIEVHEIASVTVP